MLKGVNNTFIQQEKKFFEQIEMDRLTQTDKEFSELIISTVKPLFKNQFGRINRKNVHISVIMKQFSKLTYEHMLELKKKLNKFKDKANNISAYFITMLYNIADIPKKFLSNANKKEHNKKRSYDIKKFENFAINKAELDEIKAKYGTLEPSFDDTVDTITIPSETVKSEPTEIEEEPEEINRDDEIKQILKSIECQISCKRTYKEAVKLLEKMP